MLHSGSPVVLIAPFLTRLLHLNLAFSLIPQAEELFDIFLIWCLTSAIFLSQGLKLRLDLLDLRVRRCLRQRLGEISVDSGAVTAGVQSRDHTFAIRAHPHSHVKRRAFRRLLA